MSESTLSKKDQIELTKKKETIESLKKLIIKYAKLDPKSPADSKLEAQAGAGAHGKHGKVTVGKCIEDIQTQIDKHQRDADKLEGKSAPGAKK